MSSMRLREFISKLESEGELIRIKTKVDPRFEMCEITDRISVVLSRSASSDAAAEQFREYICNQVLADSLELSATLVEGEDIELDDAVIKVQVTRK